MPLRRMCLDSVIKEVPSPSLGDGGATGTFFLCVCLIAFFFFGLRNPGKQVLGETEVRLRTGGADGGSFHTALACQPAQGPETEEATQGSSGAECFPGRGGGSQGKWRLGSVGKRAWPGLQGQGLTGTIVSP